MRTHKVRGLRVISGGYRDCGAGGRRVAEINCVHVHWIGRGDDATRLGRGRGAGEGDASGAQGSGEVQSGGVPVVAPGATVIGVGAAICGARICEGV